MSCIITYKGKQYSEEQFKEYFINNKNEFATSISKNKDVIDSFKRKMEAIDGVFKDSPELAAIGSKAQYMQYLSTIFKTSKVKDIVYRGKTENQTNQKSKELGIFFTDDKNAANIYAVKYKGDEFDDSIIQGIVNKYGLNPTIEQIKSEIAFFEKMGATKEQIEKDAKEFQKYILNNKGVSEQAILNIKNPKNLTVKDWFDNYENSSKLKENSDGLLLKGGKQSNNRVYDAGENQFVVFEPEQIHILGSKQDIKGFKNWVSSTPQSTNVDENPNQTHIDKTNAKYDAELKALGQQQENLQKEENKRQEIKRQEEELNRLIAIEEAQKEQEKAAEAEAEKQQKLRDLHNDVSFSLGFFETAVKDLSFHIEDLVDLSEIELNIEKLKTKMHDINGLLGEIEKTSIIQILLYCSL